MRIALAQMNPTVGDIPGNARRMAGVLEQAADAGAGLVVFPELAVVGYPPKDLLLKPSVIADCAAAVEGLARQCRRVAALIGYPCPSQEPVGRMLHNAAALCADGRIVHRYVKTLLPTYDVFDELRYFEPGKGIDLAEWAGLKLGVSICEDLWNDRDILGRQLYHEDPIGQLARLGADVILNCSASPFELGKHDLRRRLFSAAAQRHALPLLYCNQVGGNDELVFDGCSCAFDSHGNLLAQARDFQEDLLLVDLPAHGGTAQPNPNDQIRNPNEVTAPAARSHIQQSEISNQKSKISSGMESLYRALVLGLADYCRKCGFKSIVLGLSGGIDSAVTAALCVAALGPENVRGVAMPSRFSSDHSIADARDLAQRLGIRFDIVPIEAPHQAMEQLLTPLYESRPADSTEENVQARLRGVILMALSNKFGSLLVTTGNKSELAVGYCTLYGDMAGGLAVISDVPKTMIWELARWINSPACPLVARLGRAVIPQNSIDKAPSAELRPNQTDQDSLPPYEVLDQIVERYVEREQSAGQIIREAGLDPATVTRVVRLIDLNEYKRKQAAPGLKVTGRAFGFGRRMPIAQKYSPNPG